MPKKPMMKITTATSEHPHPTRLTGWRFSMNSPMAILSAVGVGAGADDDDETPGIGVGEISRENFLLRISCSRARAISSRCLSIKALITTPHFGQLPKRSSPKVL